MTLREYLDLQFADPFKMAVLSGPRTKEAAEKIRLRPVRQDIKREEEKKLPYPEEKEKPVIFQAESYKGTQVFHRNFTSVNEMILFLEENLQDEYRQLQVQGQAMDGTVLVSKKGKTTIRTSMHKEQKTVKITGHNRVKNYILKEGVPVPFLTDLGVMTKDGKIISQRYDKFRQVNRFLEFIEDILPNLPEDRCIRILDFGCGKSYLTFAVYYYLHELKGREVTITGLDLKEDVIHHCNELAEKYGYRNLRFMTGDVAEYECSGGVDLMITLHACDTATDYALYRAVTWGAGVILSVPCCQHEVNAQIQNEELYPLMKYGIIKERFSALLTDSLRAEILTSMGYDTQILEFIDMEHTPKNLLIRAVRTGKKNLAAKEKISSIMAAFHIEPTLYRLFSQEMNK